MKIPTIDPEEALRFCRALCAAAGNQNLVEGSSLNAPPAPAISIVTPVYNEESNILPFYGKVSQVLRQIGVSYEIVFHR